MSRPVAGLAGKSRLVAGLAGKSRLVAGLAGKSMLWPYFMRNAHIGGSAWCVSRLVVV